MMQNRRRLVDKNAVDDLVMLDTIQESKIVECLQNRYAQDMIYTNIGPVLIAINPFKMIPQLYTDAKIREYKGKKAFELAPHVFALADETYMAMINYRENQCVIITGESGSGKTETSKFIMQYISAVSGRSAEVLRVKERMLSSNPILEGFGNAKTVNNNNSSRFGKYMEILFEGGDPVGGRVTNYLLEKSRVVAPGQNERNFHVFYQVTAGASAEERNRYCIESPEYYYYLTQSNCFTVQGVDDAGEYRELIDAFRSMGITDSERGDVMCCLSSILWLGNVAFQEMKPEVASVQDKRVLDVVAGLLQINVNALETCLCVRNIQTGVGAKAEKFAKPLKATEADFCRDTLAKALYSRMFDWLVFKINQAIKKENHTGTQIGVLDIYGFEIFQFNSFEQLCINFVNEKLQQIFIELTLKAEQEEYASEGIPWKDIPYTNNKPLCDLIESKPGLFSICDDCCHTSKTDAMFVGDLRSFFGQSPYIHCGSTDFSVRHYAGDVRYDSNGFLTKNKDTLFDDLIMVMQTSPCGFIRDHGWAQLEVSDAQKKKPPTVGAVFKVQVEALMKALKSCVPHYIRCIKPNHQKTPNNFDREYIGRQVKYLGLLENVRVRRAGYAHRSVYERFLKRYGMLSRGVWNGSIRGSGPQLATEVCRGIGWQQNREYALGKTKIFIQDATSLFNLEDMLERKLNDACIIIQKTYRKYKQKRVYMEARADAYDIVNMKKERRRGSISGQYKGDYLNAGYDKLVNALITQSGPKEKVLFATRINVIPLAAKKGFFQSLFGKKEQEPPNPRLLLLTDKALYTYTYDLDPPTLPNQPPPSSQVVKLTLHFRASLPQIASITLSPFADNYMVLHFFEGAGIRDTLCSCRRKTEFLGWLSNASKASGRQTMFSFQPSDVIVVNKEKKREVILTWVKDEMVNTNMDQLIRVKHNVEIHVPSGVSNTSVTPPTRPPKIDWTPTGRASLRALYDCNGNGTDELAFRAGDIIWIVKEEVDGWYEGELNGKQGFVPGTYVERVKREVKGGRPGAGGGGGKGPSSPPSSKKSDWEELTDPASGSVYYYNNKTGESTWDKPAELIAPPPSAAGGGGVASPKPLNGGGGGRFSNLPRGGGGGGPSTGVSSPPSFGGATPSTNAVSAAKTTFGGPSTAGAGVSPAPMKPFGGGTEKPRNPALLALGGGSGMVGGPKPGFGALPGMASPSSAPPGAAGGGPSKTPAGMYSGASAGGGGGGGGGGGRMPMPGMGGMGMALPGMGMGGGGARPGPGPMPVKKKSDWEELSDPASGSKYYYNNVTGESTWDKPANF